MRTRSRSHRKFGRNWRRRFSRTCFRCGGTGKFDSGETCYYCNGTGRVDD